MSLSKQRQALEDLTAQAFARVYIAGGDPAKLLREGWSKTAWLRIKHRAWKIIVTNQSLQGQP
jgi:hypothetical protein